MRSYCVDILYIEYAGGGTSWEYSVLEGGIKRYESENGYGSLEAAARDGFGWILETDEAWKTGDVVSGPNSSDSPTQEVKVIRDDGD